MSSVPHELSQPTGMVARSVTPSARRLGKPARLLMLAVPFLWLVIWEGAVQTGVLDHRWAPPPTNVVPQMLNLFRTGFVWPYLATTALHLTIGYLLGVMAAILLKWVGVRYQWLWNTCGLLLIMLVICLLLPLLIVMLGYFRWVDPFTVIGVVGSTFLTTLWAARVDGQEPFTSLVGSASILTSLRLSAWIGLFMVLSLETIGRTNGLGYVLWRSWETFSAETLYAVMMLAALAAYLIWWLFDIVVTALMPRYHKV
jgi:ABC-type nitrate/sulfonate/bicarbonate transport system permease component